MKDINNTHELRNIALEKLIPQKEPFLMIDCLTYFDRVRTIAEFTVKETNLFVSDSELSACGVLENIAQTCAARIGYVNLISNQPVRIGFIGAVRDFNLLRAPKVGEVLHTTIDVREEVFQMTLADAYIKVDEEVIASAEMKIALSGINADA